MKVIAVSGFKGSGKDLLASHLVQKYSFKRVSFADPLKDMVSDLFDIPREYLDDPKLKEQPLFQYPAPVTDGFTSMISRFMIQEFRTDEGFWAEVADVSEEDGVLQSFVYDWNNLYHTPRSLAILIGSSFRSASPSFWVNKAIKAINKSEQNVVISDLRYRSEYEQLKQSFGEDLVTIRINRFDNCPSNDPSENDLLDYPHDFTITNKGTQEELFQKIDKVLTKSL
jgi:hypothetical protein